MYKLFRKHFSGDILGIIHLKQVMNTIELSENTVKH